MATRTRVQQAAPAFGRWSVRSTGIMATRDGIAWSAEVRKDGALVGRVHDEGNGGGLFCSEPQGRYVGTGECAEGAEQGTWLAEFRADLRRDATLARFIPVTDDCAPSQVLCLMAYCSESKMALPEYLAALREAVRS